MLPVEQNGFIIKPHIATHGRCHKVSRPVVPHTVFRLDFFLRQHHCLAKHHGVAAGNVLHQRIAKAGRAAYAGAQANRLQPFVDELCAPTVQARILALVLSVPFHRALKFVVQPHIVLVAKGKQVLGLPFRHLRNQVAKVPRRTFARPLQHGHRLAHPLGKPVHQGQGVVCRSIIAHRQRPMRVALALDRGQLLCNEAATVISSQQDVDGGLVGHEIIQLSFCQVTIVFTRIFRQLGGARP